MNIGQGRTGQKKARRIDLDMHKLEEAVHYICARTPNYLGAVKLNKTLFYADMLHYAHTGSSITGATYSKQHLGPVPKQVRPAIRNLEQGGRLKTENISVFDKVRREFTTYGETDTSVFSKEEIQRLDEVVQMLDGVTGAELSDLSHTIVWQVAEIGETLPYESFLISYLGDLTEEDLAVAKIAVSQVEKTQGRAYA
jgi:hypothetical protein